MLHPVFENEKKTVTCKACYWHQQTASKESNMIGTQNGSNSYSRQLKIPTEIIASPPQGMSCFRNVATCEYSYVDCGKKIRHKRRYNSTRMNGVAIPHDSGLNGHKRENFETQRAPRLWLSFLLFELVHRELNYAVILLSARFRRQC